MATTLLQLPLEVVQIVSGYLDLPDLHNLRHVCQYVNAGVTSSRRLRGFYKKTSVDLQVSKLKELAALLSTSPLLCDLEHLTLTGVLIVTAGLERIVREETKPKNLQDPCGMKRSETGDSFPAERIAATPDDLLDAKIQLETFRQRSRVLKEEQSSGADVAALGVLFEAIRTGCRAGRLKSLTLDLVVYREPTTRLPPAMGAPWRHVWTLAEHVFAISLQAWLSSGIEIEHLDVFSEAEGCGVQGYKITELQGTIDFAKLRGLKALSLRCSNRVIPINAYHHDREADWDEDGLVERNVASVEERPTPEDVDEEHTRKLELLRIYGMLMSGKNHSGLVHWLQCTPSLEQLHLCNCTAGHFACAKFRAIARINTLLYGSIAKRAPLSNLRQLTIRNTSIATAAALLILRNSPQLKSLVMRDIQLAKPRRQQGWDVVLAHLTSPEAELSYIFLDNLFERDWITSNHISCFTPGMKPGDSLSSGETAKERMARLELEDWDFNRPGPKGYSAFELTRREDVLRGIDFRRNGRYSEDTVQRSKWTEQVRRQYSIQ